MKPLDVLMPVEGMGLVADLIAERLPLHRLWLEADPEAWLAEWAPQLRAVASNGHQFPIDAAFMRRLPQLEIVASFGVGYDHIDANGRASAASSSPIRRACSTTRSPTSPWR